MAKKSYDTVIYNANVVTMDPANETAEMVAIKDDKFTYVGEYKAEITTQAKSEMDVDGKTIIPGFIDLHTHLWKEANVISIDLGSFRTYEEVVKKLEAEVKTRKSGEWIFASKWDESKWEDQKQFLSREDLDAISPENPVYTHREDGHLCVCNSLALEKLPISKSHPGVEKDSSGKLTGVLKDVWLDLTPMYKHLIPESIEKSTYIAASKGITTAVDNLTIMPEGQKNVLEAYRKLDLDGKLPIRVFLNPTYELMKKNAELGIKRNTGTPKLKYSSFKGFFDGALGAHTALLSSPYHDAEGNGDQFLDEEELISRIFYAEQNDYTLCIHAIGDLAIEKLLNCYEKGIKKAERKSSSYHHRIEHAEMITNSQIKKAKELGILLSMQPNFLKWQFPGELYEQRLGKERFMNLNRYATILQLGSQIYFGSDNMPLSPIYGIQQVTSFPSSDVKISVKQALQAYTLNNADALFMESQLGSITEGKYADYVILSKSLMELEPYQLTDDLIEQTIVGGTEVYSGNI
ncbi:MAG: amidohydrolase [Candidatus Hodarchaeales archaeon]|jgi:predicted amidohydrolase YtcJ